MCSPVSEFEVNIHHNLSKENKGEEENKIVRKNILRDML